MLPEALTFLDIETTGSSLRKSKIVEIAAIRVENGKVVKELNTLINPLCSIPPEIETFNGITNELVEGKPTFEQISSEILDILRDSCLVAHNVSFDYAFLKTEFKSIGTSFKCKHFCTVQLSRALYKRERHHNLDAVIERCGLVCEDRHRAYGDTLAIFEFFKHVVSEFGAEVIEETINKISKSASRPSNLPSIQIENLPETPGVYIFYGQNELPIYVGKSKNIKNRILSHFYDANESNKDQNFFNK
ncbi:MAG TPA: exonuclease domain-containing protein [Candidatus Saccharimonadales bacterium]|nr:exonuclease domain-containing protein [Candidatus Saccharimonadales bacterium]